MKEEVKRLKAEVGEVLENNILSFWLDKMQDEENGGFYGQMTGERVVCIDGVNYPCIDGTEQGFPPRMTGSWSGRAT